MRLSSFRICGAPVAAFAALLAAACSAVPRADEPLIVFAASSLQPALQDVSASFRAAGGDSMVLVFGSTTDLATQIENGADFGDLARQHSRCPSSQKGGALGEFRPGQMVPEFDRVVFSADVGTVQGPVKTQFGWHLVEVTARTD